MAIRVDARGWAPATTDRASLAAAGTAAAGLGATVGTGRWEFLLCVLTAAGVVVGLRNWRWAVWGLILFLPFAGIPILAFHDDTAGSLSRGVPTLTKDLVFVLPAYAGFAFAFVRARRSPWLPALGRWPLVFAAALAVTVLIEALNPRTPSLLVAAIGVKVWLLYLPMYLVGFYFVRNRDDLERLLRTMTLLALIPAIIGLASAALLYSGYEDVVYGAYGDAASSATQGFVALDFDRSGSTVKRIPSTFSFYTQYFCFLMAMITVAWAWWRTRRPGDRQRTHALIALLILIAAAFLSGSRNAYLAVPAVIGLALVLELWSNRRLHVSVRAVAVTLATAGVLVSLGLAQEAVDLVSYNLDQTFLDPLSNVLRDSTFVLGDGAGTNTVSARYGASNLADRYYDSWYLKALVELGVAGLLLTLALFGSLLGRLWRAYRDLQGSPFLPVVASFLSFGAWMVANNIKGFYLDVDPTNVYFWLFAGIAVKLALLARPERPARGA